MSLAAKLPYDHPYAGGYPGIGSQPLPTDGDALTYLSAVAVADGAGVEVGVANAIDAFVRGCKNDGVWDAIKACCILCGARTLAGALVPLVGAAPTNVADGFVSGDYNRETGLKGDGTSYLDSGRAVNADGDNDHHISVFLSSGSVASGEYLIGAMSTASSYTIAGYAMYSRTGAVTANLEEGVGFYGVSRDNASDFDYVKAGGSVASAVRSTVSADLSGSHLVFAYGNAAGTPTGLSDARLAFYSIGSALDLAALDTHVSNLVANIGAAI